CVFIPNAALRYPRGARQGNGDPDELVPRQRSLCGEAGWDVRSGLQQDQGCGQLTGPRVPDAGSDGRLRRREEITDGDGDAASAGAEGDRRADFAADG